LSAELKAETQGQAQRRSAQAQRGRLRETPCTRGERSSLAALAVAVAAASCVNRRRFGGGEQDEGRVSVPASCPRLAVSKKEGCRGAKALRSGRFRTARPAGIEEERWSVQTAFSAADKKPGHGFTLASQLRAEVEQLLPRVAKSVSNHGCRCVAQVRILFAPISDEPRSRFAEGACTPPSERFPFSDAAPSRPRRTQL
jgi:hypothetical protein